MSYNSLGLYIDRGRTNNAAGEAAFAMHGYKSLTDTLATIAAANYFPDTLGARSDEVRVSDLMILNGSDDARIYKITALSPLTLVEEVLSDNPFNQDLNTTDGVTFASQTITNDLTVTGDIINTTQAVVNAQWTGAFSSPVNGGDLSLQKIGLQVTLMIPAFQSTADSAGTIQLVGTLGAAYSPAISVKTVAEVEDNTTVKFGCLEVTAGGAVIFSNGVSGTAFTGSGDTGIAPSVISYLTSA